MQNFTKDEEYNALKAKFDVYYTENMQPVLQQSEKTRHKYLLVFFILLLMACVFYPYILLIILSMPLENNDATIGYILALSGFILIVLNGPMYFYCHKVKPEVMPSFAGFFGNFQYTHEKTLENELLDSSGLFGKYNKNIGDDFFYGRYDDVAVAIAEEKLKYITFDEKRRKNEKKIFAGVCVLLEMNKPFLGHTLVLEDKGIFNAFYRVKGLENIKLEDSKFEKIFEVYSDSQIEARYLLTTAFMERILKLQDLYEGKSIQLSFQHNQLLIAISTHQNLFEANSFFRSNINKKRIDLVFDQFYTIFSIIKILKLNQRIGV